MTEKQQDTAARDVRELLRTSVQSFSPAERRVADTVLVDPLAVLNMSVTQLANTADVSAATVIRMCNTIGLRGYQELKTRIAVEHDPANEFPGLLDSSTPTANVLRDLASALADAAAVINETKVEEIADYLVNANRIRVAAVGTSSMLASDFAYRLSMLGLNSSFDADIHVQQVAARMLNPGDLMFVVSHTGSTHESLAAARAARAAGSNIVALTSFTRSPLTELCDAVLIAGSSETRIRVEASSSRLVHMGVLDALLSLLGKLLPNAEDNLKATADIIAEHRY